MEFGHLDHTIDSQIPNASLAWNLLFGSQPEKHQAFLKKNSTWQNLSQGIELLQSLFSSLDQLGNFSQSENFKSEISLGLELSILSLEHGIAMLQGTRLPKNYTSKTLSPSSKAIGLPELGREG
jgi:hypothetical protein